jgi:hypothetical protein
MATTSANVTTANSNGDYALGYTNFEHERLIGQAARIAPYTDDYSAKRALVRGSESSISAPALGTSPCCWPESLAHRER